MTESTDTSRLSGLQIMPLRNGYGDPELDEGGWGTAINRQQGSETRQRALMCVYWGDGELVIGRVSTRDGRW